MKPREITYPVENVKRPKNNPESGPGCHRELAIIVIDTTKLQMPTPRRKQSAIFASGYCPKIAR
jgi:hypothetical protein